MNSDRQEALPWELRAKPIAAQGPLCIVIVSASARSPATASWKILCLARMAKLEFSSFKWSEKLGAGQADPDGTAGGRGSSQCADENCRRKTGRRINDVHNYGAPAASVGL
jgi:hypothetical protein